MCRRMANCDRFARISPGSVVPIALNVWMLEPLWSLDVGVWCFTFGRCPRQNVIASARGFF